MTVMIGRSKIVKAKVEFKNRWANDPELVLHVEGEPYNDDEMKFEFKEPGLYFAEKEGWVSFYFYEVPGEGFGGRVFEITLKDGKKLSLVGPWSSRSGSMNKAGFPLSMEATTYTIGDHSCGIARAITVEKFKEIVAEFFPDLQYEMVEKYDTDLTLVIKKDQPLNTREDMKCKECGKEVEGSYSLCDDCLKEVRRWQNAGRGS